MKERIELTCESCKNIFSLAIGSSYSRYKNDRKQKYNNKDLCASCKQIQQYKEGKREKQREFISTLSERTQKGKTLEERLGIDKAAQMKQKISLAISGENNPNFGGIYHGGINYAEFQRGKTYEEIYGEEKAQEIKNRLSLASSGENNPMFGVPSPMGSGNGYSGWYKNIFFRSYLELKYLKYLLDNEIPFESGEKKKYRVEYTINGNKKSYFPDFYLINENMFIEVKPKKLVTSTTNTLKFDAIRATGKKLNIITEDDVKDISIEEIESFIDKNLLKFTDRTREKFNEWKKK